MKEWSNAPIISEANMLAPAVQDAQKKAEIKNAAIRHGQRMAAYAAWVEPKAMAERKERHEREAAASLASIKAALDIGELGPLPDLSTLPPDVRCQQPSYIRKWLAHQKENERVLAALDTLDKVAIAIVDGGEVTINHEVVKPSLWQRFLDWFR